VNWCFWTLKADREVLWAFARRFRWTRGTGHIIAGEEDIVRWFEALQEGSVHMEGDALAVHGPQSQAGEPTPPIARVRLRRLGGSLFVSCAGFPEDFETRLVSVIASDLDIREWRLDVEHPEFTAG